MTNFAGLNSSDFTHNCEDDVSGAMGKFLNMDIGIQCVVLLISFLLSHLLSLSLFSSSSLLLFLGTFSIIGAHMTVANGAPISVDQ
mgnify:CR=1 FL=1